MKDGLQRVVHHSAIRLCAGDCAAVPLDFIEHGWTLTIGKKRAGRCTWSRRAGTGGRHNWLGVEEGHHKVVRHLPDVANLNGRGWIQLVLQGEVPLVVDRRLHVLIPHAKDGSAKARERRTSETWRGCRCNDAI